MLSLLWIALCAFLLREYRLRPNGVLLTLLMVFSVGMVLKLFCFDLASWHVDATSCGTASTATASSTARCDCSISARSSRSSPAATICWRERRTTDDARTAGIIFGYAAVALSLVFCTLEVNTFLHDFMPGSEAGGVSIVWSLFALGLIIAGMWKDARDDSLLRTGAVRRGGLEGALLRPQAPRSGLSDHRLPVAGRVGALRLVRLSEVSPDHCGDQESPEGGGGSRMIRTIAWCLLLGVASQCLAAQPDEFRFHKDIERRDADKESIVGGRARRRRLCRHAQTAFPI